MLGAVLFMAAVAVSVVLMFYILEKKEKKEMGL